jgi:hypothetical protein
MNKIDDNYIKKLAENVFEAIGNIIGNALQEAAMYVNEQMDKPKNIWDIRQGDKYYSIVNNRHIEEYTYNGDEYDDIAINFSNAFFTKEEAQIELERHYIEALVKKFGGIPMQKMEHLNTLHGWVLVMGKTDTETLFITPRPVSCSESCISDIIPFAFETYDKAHDAIDEIGEERLISYVLGEHYENLVVNGG